MTKNQVIQKLKALSKKAKKTRLTLSEIRKVPKLEYYIYVHYENLAEALHEAGLDSSKLAKSMATSNDELLKYLWNLKISKQKVPTSWDINKDGKFDYHIFSRRFGDLKQANKKAEEKYSPRVRQLQVDDQITLDEKVSVEVVAPIEDIEYKGNFYGVAAENLVVSELLYRGYEAYLINVDLGLDVLAQKNRKTFYLQVKNVSFDNSDDRTVKITNSSYVRNISYDVYYFLVMQKHLKRDYVIIPQFKLLELEQKGLINPSGGDKISLFVKRDNNKYYLVFGNEREGLDAYTNEKAWGYLR